MPRFPPGKAYALSAAQHQHLSDKAVALTQALNHPISCRHVLDALLALSTHIDDSTLADQVMQRIKEPRRRRLSR